MEVPQAIGGGCPNVVEEAHKLFAIHFAFGEDMVACREVLSAVALFGKMKKPRRLWRFVVAFELGSKERLVGHLPDSGPASAKSLLLVALVAEVREVENSKLNGSPESSPKAIQVAHLDRGKQNGSDCKEMSIDVLLLYVQEVSMFSFVGLL